MVARRLCDEISSLASKRQGAAENEWATKGAARGNVKNSFFLFAFISSQIDLYEWVELFKIWKLSEWQLFGKSDI